MFIPLSPFLRYIGILCAYSVSLPYTALFTINKEAVHSFQKSVRVISNYSTISDANGVPVEYWYNETSQASLFQSSPGCPQSIDGYPWVYYGSPPRCFLASFQGPCEQGQTIALQPRSHYGVCSCQCSVVDTESLQTLFMGTGRYVECINETADKLIYDRKKKSCYSKYWKGPCPEGKIFASWTSSSITCLPPCDDRNGNWSEMEANGLCVKPPRFHKSGMTPMVEGPCSFGLRRSLRLRKCIYRSPLRFRLIG